MPKIEVKYSEGENIMNEYSKFFNENMSSDEARLELLRLGDCIGKQNAKEMDKLFEAYKEISHQIIHKEIELSLKEIEVYYE